MDTEQRLKEAEALLHEVSAARRPAGFYKMVETLNKVDAFLNPEPVIDAYALKVGTMFQPKGVDYTVALTGVQRGSIDSTLESGKATYLLSEVTIPPQESHIHKCPWPDDGKQPDWVEDDDIIYPENSQVCVKASRIDWQDTFRKWFAVLKLTNYRRDLE